MEVEPLVTKVMNEYVEKSTKKEEGLGGDIATT